MSGHVAHVGQGGQSVPAAPAAASTELCSAASQGDVVRMRELIADGASVNERDDVNWKTPLHCAVTAKQIAGVRELLRHPEIDVHVQWGEEEHQRMLAGEVSSCSYRGTPLHLAVCESSPARLEIAKLLLDHGADIMRTSGGYTPFDYACEVESGERDMAEMLFAMRKDVLLKDKQWVSSSSGEFPHHLAAEANNEDVLAFLFEIDERYNVTYSRQQLTRLIAVAPSCLVLFERLFDKFRQRLMGEGDSFLFSKRDISGDVLQFLFERGYKPYRVDAKTGEVTLLLKHISDTTFRSDGAKVCIQHTPPDIVQQYNQQCSRLAVQRLSHPLYVALSDSYCFDTALLLLETGFDPRNLLWSRNSMLSYGSWELPACVVEAFMDEHCSLNAIGRVVIAPTSHHRDVSKFLKLLTMLMQRGVPITATNENEMCPLTLLAVKCYQQEELNPDQPPFAGEAWYQKSRCDKLRVQKELSATFVSLLASKPEIDLSRRRRATSAPFLCPDVTVAAALVGNTCILSHVAVKVGLNPIHLLSDLLRFVNLKFGSKYPSTSFENQMLLIITIGTSTLKLLKYSVRNAPLLQLCTDLNAKMATAHAGQLSPFYNPERLAFQRAAQDKVWEKVFKAFGKVDRLKHVCRVKIVEVLMQSIAGGTFGEKLKELDIPKSIRNYLSFTDELEFPEPQANSDDSVPI